MCEPVLTETLFLLVPYAGGQEVLFEFLSNGALKVAFRIEEHVGALRRRLAKYSDIKVNEKIPDAVFKLKTTSKTKFISTQG